MRRDSSRSSRYQQIQQRKRKRRQRRKQRSAQGYQPRLEQLESRQLLAADMVDPYGEPDGHSGGEPTAEAHAASIDRVELPASVWEDESLAFRVFLDSPAAQDTYVSYHVDDISTQGGADYGKSSGQALIAVGQTFVDVEIPLVNDEKHEPDEAVEIFVTMAGNSASGGMAESDLLADGGELPAGETQESTSGVVVIWDEDHNGYGTVVTQFEDTSTPAVYATFADEERRYTPGTTKIDWGDGTSELVPLHFDEMTNHWLVIAEHEYHHEGTYSVVVYNVAHGGHDIWMAGSTARVVPQNEDTEFQKVTHMDVLYGSCPEVNGVQYCSADFTKSDAPAKSSTFGLEAEGDASFHYEKDWKQQDVGYQTNEYEEQGTWYYDLHATGKIDPLQQDIGKFELLSYSILGSGDSEYVHDAVYRDAEDDFELKEVAESVEYFFTKAGSGTGLYSYFETRDVVMGAHVEGEDYNGQRRVISEHDYMPIVNDSPNWGFITDHSGFGRFSRNYTGTDSLTLTEVGDHLLGDFEQTRDLERSYSFSDVGRDLGGEAEREGTYGFEVRFFEEGNNRSGDFIVDIINGKRVREWTFSGTDSELHNEESVVIFTRNQRDERLFSGKVVGNDRNGAFNRTESGTDTSEVTETGHHAYGAIAFVTKIETTDHYTYSMVGNELLEFYTQIVGYDVTDRRTADYEDGVYTFGHEQVHADTGRTMVTGTYGRNSGDTKGENRKTTVDEYHNTSPNVITLNTEFTNEYSGPVSHDFLDGSEAKTELTYVGEGAAWGVGPFLSQGTSDLKGGLGSLLYRQYQTFDGHTLLGPAGEMIPFRLESKKRILKKFSVNLRGAKIEVVLYSTDYGYAVHGVNGELTSAIATAGTKAGADLVIKKMTSELAKINLEEHFEVMVEMDNGYITNLADHIPTSATVDITGDLEKFDEVVPDELRESPLLAMGSDWIKGQVGPFVANPLATLPSFGPSDPSPLPPELIVATSTGIKASAKTGKKFKNSASISTSSKTTAFLRHLDNDPQQVFIEGTKRKNDTTMEATHNGAHKSVQRKSSSEITQQTRRETNQELTIEADETFEKSSSTVRFTLSGLGPGGKSLGEKAAVLIDKDFLLLQYEDYIETQDAESKSTVNEQHTWSNNPDRKLLRSELTEGTDSYWKMRAGASGAVVAKEVITGLVGPVPGFSNGAYAKTFDTTSVKTVTEDAINQTLHRTSRTVTDDEVGGYEFGNDQTGDYSRNGEGVRKISKRVQDSNQTRHRVTTEDTHEKYGLERKGNLLYETYASRESVKAETAYDFAEANQERDYQLMRDETNRIIRDQTANGVSEDSTLHETLVGSFDAEERESIDSMTRQLAGQGTETSVRTNSTEKLKGPFSKSSESTVHYVIAGEEINSTQKSEIEKDWTDFDKSTRTGNLVTGDYSGSADEKDTTKTRSDIANQTRKALVTEIVVSSSSSTRNGKMIAGDYSENSTSGATSDTVEAVTNQTLQASAVRHQETGSTSHTVGNDNTGPYTTKTTYQSKSSQQETESNGPQMIATLSNTNGHSTVSTSGNEITGIYTTLGEAYDATDSETRLRNQTLEVHTTRFSDFGRVVDVQGNDVTTTYSSTQSGGYVEESEERETNDPMTVVRESARAGLREEKESGIKINQEFERRTEDIGTLDELQHLVNQTLTAQIDRSGTETRLTIHEADKIQSSYHIEKTDDAQLSFDEWLTNGAEEEFSGTLQRTTETIDTGASILGERTYNYSTSDNVLQSGTRTNQTRLEQLTDETRKTTSDRVVRGNEVTGWHTTSMYSTDAYSTTIAETNSPIQADVKTQHFSDKATKRTGNSVTGSYSDKSQLTSESFTERSEQNRGQQIESQSEKESTTQRVESGNEISGVFTRDDETLASSQNRRDKVNQTLTENSAAHQTVVTTEHRDGNAITGAYTDRGTTHTVGGSTDTLINQTLTRESRGERMVVARYGADGNAIRETRAETYEMNRSDITQVDSTNQTQIVDSSERRIESLSGTSHSNDITGEFTANSEGTRTVEYDESLTNQTLTTSVTQARSGETTSRSSGNRILETETSGTTFEGEYSSVSKLNNQTRARRVTDTGTFKVTDHAEENYVTGAFQSTANKEQTKLRDGKDDNQTEKQALRGGGSVTEETNSSGNKVYGDYTAKSVREDNSSEYRDVTNQNLAANYHSDTYDKVTIDEQGNSITGSYRRNTEEIATETPGGTETNRSRSAHIWNNHRVDTQSHQSGNSITGTYGKEETVAVVKNGRIEESNQSQKSATESGVRSTVKAEETGNSIVTDYHRKSIDNRTETQSVEHSNQTLKKRVDRELKIESKVDDRGNQITGQYRVSASDDVKIARDETKEENQTLHISATRSGGEHVERDESGNRIRGDYAKQADTTFERHNQRQETNRSRTVDSTLDISGNRSRKDVGNSVTSAFASAEGGLENRSGTSTTTNQTETIVENAVGTRTTDSDEYGNQIVSTYDREESSVESSVVNGTTSNQTIRTTALDSILKKSSLESQGNRIEGSYESGTTDEVERVRESTSDNQTESTRRKTVDRSSVQSGQTGNSVTGVYEQNKVESRRTEEHDTSMNQTKDVDQRQVTTTSKRLDFTGNSILGSFDGGGSGSRTVQTQRTTTNQTLVDESSTIRQEQLSIGDVGNRILGNRTTTTGAQRMETSTIVTSNQALNQHAEDQRTVQSVERLEANDVTGDYSEVREEFATLRATSGEKNQTRTANQTIDGTVRTESVKTGNAITKHYQAKSDSTKNVAAHSGYSNQTHQRSQDIQSEEKQTVRESGNQVVGNYNQRIKRTTENATTTDSRNQTYSSTQMTDEVDRFEQTEFGNRVLGDYVRDLRIEIGATYEEVETNQTEHKRASGEQSSRSESRRLGNQITGGYQSEIKKESTDEGSQEIENQTLFVVAGNAELGRTSVQESGNEITGSYSLEDVGMHKVDRIESVANQSHSADVFVGTESNWKARESGNAITTNFMRTTDATDSFRRSDSSINQTLSTRVDESKQAVGTTQDEGNRILGNSQQTSTTAKQQLHDVTVSNQTLTSAKSRQSQTLETRTKTANSVTGAYAVESVEMGRMETGTSDANQGVIAVNSEIADVEVRTRRVGNQIVTNYELSKRTETIGATTSQESNQTLSESGLGSRHVTTTGAEIGNVITGEYDSLTETEANSRTDTTGVNQTQKTQTHREATASQVLEESGNRVQGTYTTVSENFSDFEQGQGVVNKTLGSQSVSSGESSGKSRDSGNRIVGTYKQSSTGASSSLSKSKDNNQGRWVEQTKAIHSSSEAARSGNQILGNYEATADTSSRTVTDEMSGPVRESILTEVVDRAQRTNTFGNEITGVYDASEGIKKESQLDQTVRQKTRTTVVDQGTDVVSTHLHSGNSVTGDRTSVGKQTTDSHRVQEEENQTLSVTSIGQSKEIVDVESAGNTILQTEKVDETGRRSSSQSEESYNQTRSVLATTNDTASVDRQIDRNGITGRSSTREENVGAEYRSHRESNGTLRVSISSQHDVERRTLETNNSVTGEYSKDVRTGMVGRKNETDTNQTQTVARSQTDEISQHQRSLGDAITGTYQASNEKSRASVVEEKTTNQTLAIATAQGETHSVESLTNGNSVTGDFVTESTTQIRKSSEEVRDNGPQDTQLEGMSDKVVRSTRTGNRHSGEFQDRSISELDESHKELVTNQTLSTTSQSRRQSETMADTKGNSIEGTFRTDRIREQLLERDTELTNQGRTQTSNLRTESDGLDTERGNLITGSVRVESEDDLLSETQVHDLNADIEIRKTVNSDKNTVSETVENRITGEFDTELEFVDVIRDETRTITAIRDFTMIVDASVVGESSDAGNRISTVVESTLDETRQSVAARTSPTFSLTQNKETKTHLKGAANKITGEYDRTTNTIVDDETQKNGLKEGNTYQQVSRTRTKAKEADVGNQVTGKYLERRDSETTTDTMHQSTNAVGTEDLREHIHLKNEHVTDGNAIGGYYRRDGKVTEEVTFEEESRSSNRRMSSLGESVFVSTQVAIGNSVHADYSLTETFTLDKEMQQSGVRDGIVFSILTTELGTPEKKTVGNDFAGTYESVEKDQTFYSHRIESGEGEVVVTTTTGTLDYATEENGSSRTNMYSRKRAGRDTFVLNQNGMLGAIDHAFEGYEDFEETETGSLSAGWFHREGLSRGELTPVTPFDIYDSPADADPNSSDSSPDPTLGQGGALEIDYTFVEDGHFLSGYLAMTKAGTTRYDHIEPTVDGSHSEGSSEPGSIQSNLFGAPLQHHRPRGKTPKGGIANPHAAKGRMDGPGSRAHGGTNSQATTGVAGKLGQSVVADYPGHQATGGARHLAVGSQNASVYTRYCFAKGTPIRTPHGAQPIDSLEPGDVVLAAPDQESFGPVREQIVEEVFVNPNAPLLNVHIGGEVVRVTPPHPFYVQDKGWTPAGDLRPGDLLRGIDGAWVEVSDVFDNEDTEAVYNFRVANDHTYFVGDATWRFAVWVHNTYGGKILGMSANEVNVPRDNAESGRNDRSLADLAAVAETDLERVVKDLEVEVGDAQQDERDWDPLDDHDI